MTNPPIAGTQTPSTGPAANPARPHHCNRLAIVASEPRRESTPSHQPSSPRRAMP